MVANSMADRRAALVYFDTERAAMRAIRGSLGDMDLFFQDLYAEESVVEGSDAYLNNSVRDATLEEVFHLVQGAGIAPSLPAYQARIEEATAAAVENERWFTNDEWEREGSSSYEYIISVIDVFYGLWAHDPDRNGESFGGEYRYCSRDSAIARDALGVEVLREFLPDTLEFDTTVDASFEGTFHMSFDEKLPYTLKTRYLKNARLSGSHDASLIGNEHDNRLCGNGGDNKLEGLGGDDELEGGSGQDTAVFRGPVSEYEIRRTPTVVRVSDLTLGRDGNDTMRNIERIQFRDSIIHLTE